MKLKDYYRQEEDPIIVPCPICYKGKIEYSRKRIIEITKGLPKEVKLEMYKEWIENDGGITCHFCKGTGYIREN